MLERNSTSDMVWQNTGIRCRREDEQSHLVSDRHRGGLGCCGWRLRETTCGMGVSTVRASYGQRQMEPATCSLCGRMLGTAFHFTCHVCGAAYCYVHMPEKCDHGRARNTFAQQIVEIVR